ncbi:hypothetical protein K443DRAFT_123673 [Laccaria amethystina LaAM-08-1]|uniref:Uncharacterized protein n=1 Tax=Laccaria amethystina LaAM-08-1 TaxID=1095629 RepID=A0A0C9XAF2_9AGAR|nr:hypothetical protein K443DRAFT_123673 [Laccaria amethystina LaAM-08-1]
MVFEQNSWESPTVPWWLPSQQTRFTFKHNSPVKKILFTINEKTRHPDGPQAPNGTPLPLIANVSVIPTSINLKSTLASAEPIISESRLNNGSSALPHIPLLMSSGAFPKHKRMLKVHARRLPAHQAGLSVHGHGADQDGHWVCVDAAAEKLLIAGADVDDGIVMYKRTNGGRNKAGLVRNIVVQNRTSYMFSSFPSTIMEATATDSTRERLGITVLDHDALSATQYLDGRHIRVVERLMPESLCQQYHNGLRTIQL